MAEQVVKLSDGEKLQQTVETFQTVLHSISKGDEDSVQVAGLGSSGSSTRLQMFSGYAAEHSCMHN